MASGQRQRGERPRVPASVYRDLKAASGDDVDALAADYAEAGVALEGGDTGRAIQILRRAKERAGRSAAIREALGIALYLNGDFRAARRELAAYRRLSGRQDQNHLLADSARANGQPDRVEALVEEMMRSPDVPADRVAEGLMVVAGARADRGDPRAALAALHRIDLEPRTVEPYHLRVWYLAATLYEHVGDRDRAAGYYDAIATIEPDFLDIAERLAALEAEQASDQPASESGASASKRLRQ
jgi:tetratricopeptide (TPR) repeat protein